MDPLELIKDDHRRVEALFEEYDTYGDDDHAEKQTTVDALIRELEMHTEMEESIVYPALRGAFDTDGDKKVEEAYVEHDVAKNLIEDLKGLLPEDEQFDAKVTVLKENVLHHIEEEEAELLPMAEDTISAEALAIMGTEIQAFKDAQEGMAEEEDEEI